MTPEQTVRIVQVAYPQVYLACHTRHQRKKSTEHHLSARDASILAHLSERLPTMPSRLAAHLGIGRPTMSEALKRLVALGYVRRASERGAAVLLAPRGVAAIRDTSVLETERLRAVLDGVPPRDLEIIAAGLERLAAACRAQSERAAAQESA